MCATASADPSLPAPILDPKASRWDEVIALPTNPYRSYYPEANFLISKVSKSSA